MSFSTAIRSACQTANSLARRNAKWLHSQMSPYFFQAMADEPNALITLIREMDSLQFNRRLILADHDKRLILACLDEPGSLLNSLKNIETDQLSYAMFSHSHALMPEMKHALEVQRYEFDQKPNELIADLDACRIPIKLQREVIRKLQAIAPAIEPTTALRLLQVLWLNASDQICLAPPGRTAWLIWLFERGNASGGLYLDLRLVEHNGITETRVLFAVANPPQESFLTQVVEVFNRLGVGIRRAYCLTISNGVHPYFLGTFFVHHRCGAALLPGSPKAVQLQLELCNTQILNTASPLYRDWVNRGIMAGDDAALTQAFISLCHTSLAHNQPERFGLDNIQSAFYTHPEMANQLLQLFRVRFEPDKALGVERYTALAEQLANHIRDYNTGHRWLDEIRRDIYRCCLLCITHTLKTNFFVAEKQALAFRLDPAYLRELGGAFTDDLPPVLPFRVTFFYSRYGYGYHIGFSDIARGGWRTIIARTADDAVTAANTLFREVYVLAHTQHLKNKDIYEGGSKMVLILDAADRQTDLVNRLYKLQYGTANAFLDIFTTENGHARDPRVVDYYGDDEPIELGPDENMHDTMIEAIAALSRKRNYLLGVGIISSKRFGINHKQYGVTSTGVMTFAEVVMAEQGIDIGRDPFSVKLTGGPNGDVAGNCLRILLEQCLQARIVMVLDGTAAAFDPNGLSRDELQRLVLNKDLDSFDPEQLGTGGQLLFRTIRKAEGLKELHRRIERRADGSLYETWMSLDDFYRDYEAMLFTVSADLFIPAGGRPETIDAVNWQQFLQPDGTPTARIIIEGANSFITPEARLQLQKSGVVLMRDASANKCGVISSSYEIIANLLLSEQEFLAYKDRYVQDVLSILRRRAGDEARLLLQLHREADGMVPYTELSDQISQNINSLYHRLFQFFTSRPERCLKHPFRDALVRHLPGILRETPRFRRRISTLPLKYQAAILAAEIGASLVYSGNRELDFEDMVRRHLAREGRC